MVGEYSIEKIDNDVHCSAVDTISVESEASLAVDNASTTASCPVGYNLIGETSYLIRLLNFSV